MKKITLLILLVSLFALTKAQMPIYDDLQVYGTATFEKDIDVGDSVTSPIGHFDTLRFENGTYQVTAGLVEGDSLYHVDSQTWLSNGESIPKADSTRDYFVGTDSITTAKLIADTIHANNPFLLSASSSAMVDIDNALNIYASTIGIFSESSNININSANILSTSATNSYKKSTQNNYYISGSDTIAQAADTIFADGTNSSTANTFKFKTGFIDDSLTAAKVITDEMSIGGAAVIDTVYSPDYVMENTKVDKLQFNPVTQAHSEGTLFYDSVEKSLSFYNEFSDFKEEFGRGVNLMFYNNTGSTIPNGAVVRSVGAHKTSSGGIIFEGDLAGNASLDSIIGVAVATHEVLDGEYGMCTVLGKVNGLNTSAFSDNDVVFTGHAGEITNVPPEPPLWYQVLGRVGLSDNDSGTVYVKTGVTKYSPSPTFTARFEDSTETITNPGLGVYEQITSATHSLFGEVRNKGFLFQGDSISPLQDGNYTIFLSYSFQGTVSQTDLYRVGTFIDGVKEYSTSRTASGTNNGGVPYPTTVDLNAGQWISFRIENTTDASRDCVFTDGTITINYDQ